MSENDGVGTAVLVSVFGVLFAVVVSVGVVSLFAEWRGVWGSYFLMERTIEASAPIVAALALLSLFSGFLVVYVAN